MCYKRPIKVKKVTIMYAKSTTMETADQGGTALLIPLVESGSGCKGCDFQ